MHAELKALEPCDILLLNGPNLNLLGTREPSLYGSETLQTIESRLFARVAETSLRLGCRQSNFEGELVTLIQQTKTVGVKFLLLNAAAYTHTSIAIRDAVSAINIPFVEIHVSNVYKREPFRHHSYLSDKAEAVVCGLGGMGYDVALDFALKNLKGDL